MRPPTLQDVADRAGVHRATASRALNPATRHLVNRATAERIEKVAKAMGYRPSPVTRTPKPARTSTIGLLVPDQTDPLFPPIVRGIADALTGSGYTVWTLSAENDARREAAAIESMRARNVEGLILATARLEYPLLDSLLADRRCVVLVNRTPARDDVCSVSPDDAAGTAAAVRHLIDLGHREILHLAGPQDVSTGANRLAGFQQALAECGCDPEGQRVATARSWAETAGAEAVGTVLRRGVPFTAVVAASDALALGALEALGERGLVCPDDVSVIGFNDMPYVDRLNPPLTTVRVPHRDLGARAARLLLGCLSRSDERPCTLRVPVSLIVRGSTGAPRAGFARTAEPPAPRPR